MVDVASFSSRREILAGVGVTAMFAGSTVSAAEAVLEGPWTSQGRTATSAGQIHYVSVGEGSGEPLVLLHKLGGWVADWRAVAPYLSSRRRVIAIDLPGHGESLMYGPAPYIQTVPETVAMVKAMLDEIGIDQFSIVGSSLGGITGIVMASCWPKAVRRLGLLSVSLIAAMSREAIKQQDATLPPGLYGPHGEPMPRSADLLKRFGSTPQVNRENDLSRAKAGLWLRPSERGVGRVGVVDYLPRVLAPTLLIYGEHGYYRNYEAVGKAALKDARSVTIPDAGSFTQQEKPQATADAINAFLDAPLSG